MIVTSEMQTKHTQQQQQQQARKNYLVAMEPSISSGNRALHCSAQTHNQNHANNNNNTYQLPSGNKRNLIVKQFEDNKQPASNCDSLDLDVGGCQTPISAADQMDDNNNKDRDDCADANKQHVGPVMGIFFKVWSLVKVTKVRHQNNKMRRQNSEDASQFQYLSGDQLLASGGGGGGSGQHRPAAILQDRHFRRAGSQPAPSTSLANYRLDMSHQNLNQSQLQQSTARLQVQSSVGSGSNQSPPATNSLANIATGTSSTSSGVSSTSSGHQLAAACSSQPTPSPPSSASGVRRHLSAYSLRRFTSEVPVPAQQAKSANKVASSKPASSKTGNSWASKIKRSATTVNQADFSSYVSRYRFRPRDQPAGACRLAAQKKVSETVAAAVAPSKYTRPFADVGRLPAAAAYERELALQLGGQQQSDNDDGGLELDDEDTASNDIYSTPNDSIQSVPSTAPVISHNNNIENEACVSSRQPQQQQNQRQNAPSSSSHPITKSFSTSSFTHLLQQQLPPQVPQRQCTPIRELGDPTTSEGRSGQRAPSRGHNSQPDSARRLNSSRFFISSSSSEDSNHQAPGSGCTTTTAPAATATSNNGSPDQAREQAGPQLEQHAHQVAIQQGVHCHGQQQQQSSGGLVQRPDSLLIVRAQQAPYAMPVSLLTPAACRGLALPLIAAGSPIDYIAMAAMQQPTRLAAHRQPFHPAAPGSSLSYLRSGIYRRSPSMLEISSSLTSGAMLPPLPARGLSSRFSTKYPIQSGMIGAPPEGASSTSSSLRQQQQQQRTQSSRVAPPVDAKGCDELTSGDGGQLAPPSHRQRQQQHEGLPQLAHNSSITTIPNSISLHDCKLSSSGTIQNGYQPQKQYPFDTPPISTPLWPEASGALERRAAADACGGDSDSSEYRLAQMLLECGSNPSAKDGNGYTTLMHAVLSDNLPAVKCLLEHGANLDDTNQMGRSALDLVCARAPTRARLEILKLLIDNRADLDRTRASDGTRLLDRLIYEHNQLCADKLPFIDCLLQSGAKLGSSTWLAASGKQEIQLRLLQKLCQDGYFLYKKSAIEAAVYRFEYALKRLAELEQQLAAANYSGLSHQQSQFPLAAARQLKYQTYLGLSRCERKRKFYKRALEFAHLAILVDSTSYEGYYSKAHILKDLGETDDALLAIDQTQRQVARSIESIELQLSDLQQQQEALVFDGCFNMLDPGRCTAGNWIEASRLELRGTLDYMQEAKRFVSKLKAEIMDEKLKSTASVGANGGHHQPQQTAATTSQTTSALSSAKPIAI